MINIIHIADLHLDSPIGPLPSHIAALRKTQLMSAFQDALNYAKNNSTNIILISGDLFDTPKAGQAAINKLTSFASSNPEIQIFVSPGNHD